MNKSSICLSIAAVLAGCQDNPLPSHKWTDCVAWPLESHTAQEMTELGVTPEAVVASWGRVQFLPDDEAFPELVMVLDASTASGTSRVDASSTCEGWALTVNATGVWEGYDAPLEMGWIRNTYPRPPPFIGSPPPAPGPAILVQAAGLLPHGNPVSSDAFVAALASWVVAEIESSMLGGGSVEVQSLSADVVADVDTLRGELTVYGTYTIDGAAPQDPYWGRTEAVSLVVDGTLPYVGP